MPDDTTNVTSISATTGFDAIMQKAKAGLSEQAKKKFEGKVKELGDKLVAARKAHRDTIAIANTTLENEEKIMKESFEVLRKEYEDYTSIEFN